MNAIVVGGGAAGLTAAGRMAESGVAVTVLERNPRPARKILVTGKGRCNLTNACSVADCVANVPGNGSFLYSAFSRFSPQDTMAWMESLGVPLKVERGNRVFPCSDKAMDIADALQRYARQNGVRVLQERVTDLRLSDGCCVGVCTESGLKLDADAVVVATGGCSYPQTGSTGDGYTLARQAGHTVVPPRPSLIALVSPDRACAEMQGLSLRNVACRLVDGTSGRTVFDDLGELLFTHFGVSGPLVLSASAHIRDGHPERYRLELDWKPGLSPEQLDKRLVRDFQEAANLDFSNALTRLLPHKAIPVMVRLSGILPYTKCHSVTREQRGRLVELLKCFPVALSDFRPIEEAVITAGGVSVKEVQAGSMASKLVDGLYFAGEVLDVDAYTGGFNLQIAFATGMAAGAAIAARRNAYWMDQEDRSMNKPVSVALDGPSGAGKSSIAKALAAAFGYSYVDTGALYRAVGRHMLLQGLDPADAEQVLPRLDGLNVQLRYDEQGHQQVWVNGEDVTPFIRTPEVSMAASAVSAIPQVRRFLFDTQRDAAARYSVIMDGRDIGTVVLPDADVKIFLTASAEVRAMRRFRELEQRGTPAPYDEVLQDMIRRDYNDSHRAAAPLKAAQDAILLNTDDMDLEQSVAAAKKIVEDTLEAKRA